LQRALDLRFEGDPSFEIHKQFVTEGVVPFPEVPHASGKTCVALGALRIGSEVLVKAVQEGDVPWAFWVGRKERGLFQACLQAHASYDRWERVGLPVRGAFDLLYTTHGHVVGQPVASNTAQFQSKTVRWDEAPQGHAVWVRPDGHNTLRVVLSEGDPGEYAFNEQVITL
jgi:hypothetical protein